MRNFITAPHPCRQRKKQCATAHPTLKLHLATQTSVNRIRQIKGKFLSFGLMMQVGDFGQYGLARIGVNLTNEIIEKMFGELPT